MRSRMSPPVSARIARGAFARSGASALLRPLPPARERAACDHAASIRRRRQHVPTGSDDAAMMALAQEWQRNEPNNRGVPRQVEFGAFEDFAAYARHRDMGSVTILERRDSRTQSRADTALSAVLSTAALRSEWADPATQRAFGGDFQAYSAFRRTVAHGAVRMVRNSPGVIKG